VLVAELWSAFQEDALSLAASILFRARLLAPVEAQLRGRDARDQTASFANSVGPKVGGQQLRLDEQLGVGNYLAREAFQALRFGCNGQQDQADDWLCDRTSLYQKMSGHRSRSHVVVLPAEPVSRVLSVWVTYSLSTSMASCDSKAGTLNREIAGGGPVGHGALYPPKWANS